MIVLRVLTVEDWPTWRRLRLAALADAPYAFGSTLADWQGAGDTEDRWRARLGMPDSQNLVAELEGEPVGMASGVPADHDRAAAEVISMWVAPKVRGRGVGDALLLGVETWARQRGAATLRLSVSEGNDPAAGLYERHGFADTGEREVMPDGVRRERVLAKRLGAVTSGDRVVGLAADDAHRFSKVPRRRIALLEGLGVEGDAHSGERVQHRSRVRQNPDQPNLRQVHLLPSEFFDLAREHGFELAVGNLGENITTAGIDLLALPRDTRLRIGQDAVVRLTGLRNPCHQIDHFRHGLLKVAVTTAPDGDLVRRTGVMGVVEQGGEVGLGDGVVVELPPEPHVALERV
ncbi:MAG TPA: GNAT family N-acetyltransferase [Nocardioidaceae bacterium]|nr:GNAT family N-acetyltransferase [Nocardioidaceae bacterium]